MPARSMKRRVLTAAGTVLILALTAGGFLQAGRVFAKNRIIDETSARQFAYVDADVETENVISSSAELVWKGMEYIYEVEFETRGAAYEYTVRALDGTIMKRSSEIGENIISNKNEPSVSPSSEKPAPTVKADANAEKKNGGKYITVDEAKEIALKEAGVSAKAAVFTEAKMDEEDGRDCYSIEFYAGDQEYEYTVDALTGEVLESSVEPAGTQPSADADQGEKQVPSTASSDTKTEPEAAGTAPKSQAAAEVKEHHDDRDDDDRDDDDSRDDWDDADDSRDDWDDDDGGQDDWDDDDGGRDDDWDDDDGGRDDDRGEDRDDDDDGDNDRDDDD